MESEPARISQLQPSDSVAPYLNNFVTDRTGLWRLVQNIKYWSFLQALCCFVPVEILWTGEGIAHFAKRYGTARQGARPTRTSAADQEVRPTRAR
jgi:hypothetical protein